MLLGVPDRVIDQIMGWEPGAVRMRARYLHVPDHLLKEVARKIGTAIWGAPLELPLWTKTRTTAPEKTSKGPTATGGALRRIARREQWRTTRDSNS
jgi:hypothetical protein